MEEADETRARVRVPGSLSETARSRTAPSSFLTSAPLPGLALILAQRMKTVFWMLWGGSGKLIVACRPRRRVANALAEAGRSSRVGRLRRGPAPSTNWVEEESRRRAARQGEAMSSQKKP